MIVFLHIAKIVFRELFELLNNNQGVLSFISIIIGLFTIFISLVIAIYVLEEGIKLNKKIRRKDLIVMLLRETFINLVFMNALEDEMPRKTVNSGGRFIPALPRSVVVDKIAEPENLFSLEVPLQGNVTELLHQITQLEKEYYHWRDSIDASNKKKEDAQGQLILGIGKRVIKNALLLFCRSIGILGKKYDYTNDPIGSRIQNLTFVELVGRILPLIGNALVVFDSEELKSYGKINKGQISVICWEDEAINKKDFLSVVAVKKLLFDTNPTPPPSDHKPQH